MERPPFEFEMTVSMHKIKKMDGFNFRECCQNQKFSVTILNSSILFQNKKKHNHENEVFNFNYFVKKRNLYKKLT